MRILSLIILLFTVNLVHATDYYLDVDATGTGDGLSIENAFVSFDQVSTSSFGSGDTLFISGGTTSKTYYLSDRFYPPSGSTIKVYQNNLHNGLVILDGRDVVPTIFEIRNRSNIVIDGEVNGERHIRLQNWGHNNAGSTSIAISGYGTGRRHDGIILRYLEIINDDTTCTEADCSDIELKYCMYLSATGGGTLIEHNYFEGCIRETIVAGSSRYRDGDESYDSTIIQYNELRGYRDQYGRGGPDGIKGAINTTIRYNKIYHEELDNAEYRPSHAAEDGIQLLGGYVKVYGNEIYGYSQGPVRADGDTLTNAFIFNNLLYATAVYGIQRGIQLDLIDYYNVHVYNNTLVGFKNIGIHVSTRPETVSTDVKVYNNILVDCPMVRDNDGDTSLLDIDYNLCLNEDYSYRDCGPQLHTPYDPQKTFAFMSYSLGASSNDFRLSGTDNMAAASGLNLQEYFNEDITQSTRTLWSLGAYEFGATKKSNNFESPIIKTIKSF